MWKFSNIVFDKTKQIICGQYCRYCYGWAQNHHIHYLKIKQEEIPTEVTNTKPLAPEYQKILEDYKDIFPKQLPKGLPPRRNVDYKIILEPKSKPPFEPVYRISFKEQDEL